MMKLFNRTYSVIYILYFMATVVNGEDILNTMSKLCILNVNSIISVSATIHEEKPNVINISQHNLVDTKSDDKLLFSIEYAPASIVEAALWLSESKKTLCIASGMWMGARFKYELYAFIYDYESGKLTPFSCQQDRRLPYKKNNGYRLKPLNIMHALQNQLEASSPFRIVGLPEISPYRIEEMSVESINENSFNLKGIINKTWLFRLPVTAIEESQKIEIGHVVVKKTQEK